jgi:hypothetical protein
VGISGKEWEGKEKEWDEVGRSGKEWERVEGVRGKVADSCSRTRSDGVMEGRKTRGWVHME